MPARATRLFGGRRLTPSAAWLAAVNVVCVVGLCVISALMLWDMRREIGERNSLAARSLLQVLGHDIGRNIELYDLSLQAVVEGLKRSDTEALSPELRHMMLFDRAANALGFGNILVLDAKGDAITSSLSIVPPRVNNFDRPYFQHFAANPDDGLRIDPPRISRVSGRWTLQMSRRVSNADGSFGGVIVGAIFLDYFRGLFTAAGADRGSPVTLIGPEGHLLMRSPFNERDLGRDLSQMASYRELMRAKSGAFDGPAMFGDGERRHIFTHVEGQPLQLVLSAQATELYAGWHSKAWGFGSIVACLCAVTLLLTWLFRRELSHRKRAEDALVRLNLELGTLATTDALTGLSNRRRFDEMLAREWKRSIRTDGPVALILLDVDHFKGFNDLYGHQKGDEALRAIARAIEAESGRPGDVACRIGGEEFAVLLADTDVAGAHQIAERIRARVSGIRVEHAASPYGHVTISGGVAERTLTGPADTVAFVAAADGALYRAKRLGRDQVRVAEAAAADLLLAS